MKKLIIIFIVIFSGFNTLNSQWVKVCDISGGGLEGLADNGSYIYAIRSGIGVFKSTNNGNNWTLLNTGFSLYNLNAIAAKDSFVFIASDSGIYRSNNYGLNWTYVKNWGSFSLSILNKNGIDYIFAGSVGILRSSDWGNNWITVNNGLPSYPSAFSMSSSNGNIYSGILSGSFTGIYRSTNLGNNWIFASDTLQIYSKSLYSYNNLVISGGGGDVSISTNYGNYWRAIPGMHNGAFLFGFASVGIKDVFIASWYYGFYVSNDTGQTFNLRNEGLGNLYPTALHRFGNYLYISLNSLYGNGGIYRRPLNEVIGINNISSEIPNSSKLFQNYPNPFNSTTNIQWSLSKTGNVKVKIYNILGKEVVILVNEKQKAGVYEVMFDGYNLSTGIYFYRLIIDGNIINTKKLILLK